jgi:ATP-dependent Clp protease protease subunit
MSNETWMNAKKAVELGFADEVLFESGKESPEEEKATVDKSQVAAVGAMYSSRMMDLAILNRLGVSDAAEPKVEEPSPIIGMDGKTKDGAMPYEILRNQLDFLR